MPCAAPSSPRAGDRRRPADRRGLGARGRARSRSSRARAGADPETLRRILRALASDGIFTEVEPGVFANTEASEVLRGDGWRDFAHLFGGIWLARRSARSTPRGRSTFRGSARDRLLVVARRATRPSARPSTARWSKVREARLERLDSVGWQRRRDDRRRRRRQRLAAARAARATSGDARHRLRPARDGARRSGVRRALRVRRRRLLRARSRRRRVPPLDDPARLGRRLGATDTAHDPGRCEAGHEARPARRNARRTATSPTAPSGSIC